MAQPGSRLAASRLARRRRALLAVGIAAALLAVGGLIGASFVKSPQQLAADTAAPPPTVTTAPVVSQVLTSSVQLRGVVYPATQYDVYATAPSDPGASGGGGAAPGAGGSGSVAYISKLDVAAGGTVRNGERLAEIDGQPLFALAGPVPAWRDLTPGESGPDVTELQKALAALGYYDDGDTPGYFGPATGYAVYLYYEHLGYTPPSTGGVPAADVVFLPSLPATVVAVNGAAGQQPGQPFLELAARGSLALTGELPPAYAGQVKPGLKVAIDDEVTGIRTAGTVAQDFDDATGQRALAGIATLSNDIATDVQDHAAVKNATRAWTACMTRNGYSLGQPDTVFRQELRNMFGDSHQISPASTVSATANRAQIATAVTDATCTDSADLAGIYFAVQASYEQQIVNANQQALTTAVQQYRTAYAKELKNLPTLLKTAKASPAKQRPPASPSPTSATS